MLRRLLLMSLMATGLADPAVTQKAVFAGGCYWGVEAVFEHVRGVTRATSGFSEGVEAVEVEFDPAVVSYRELLEVFFIVAHDPTSRDRQGPDRGPEYRAIVYYRNTQQRTATVAYLRELAASGRFSQPIVTELGQFRDFTPVGEDQQDYAAKNPQLPYIVINDLPKIERLRREFPQLYVGRN